MLVSVVIPTYNRRRVIGSAVDSVLQQQGVPVEVLVVDDGSTDDTVPWLAAQYAGAPVRVLRNAGAKGPAGARNTGLAAATGELVALLDSDDRFLPGHLAAAADVMAAYPDVGVVFGRARYLQQGQPVPYMGPNFERKLAMAPKRHDDATLAVFTPDFFEHLLVHGCWFNLSSVVLGRSAAQERMREDLRVAEDYEFWVRLARRYGFACLKSEQIEYTLGDDNISFESDQRVEGHAPQLLRAYGYMLVYPHLQARHRRVIRERIARELFDWGFRAAVQGQTAAAMRLHARSMRYGLRARNAAAMVKAVLRAVATR